MTSEITSKVKALYSVMQSCEVRVTIESNQGNDYCLVCLTAQRLALRDALIKLTKKVCTHREHTWTTPCVSIHTVTPGWWRRHRGPIWQYQQGWYGKGVAQLAGAHWLGQHEHTCRRWCRAWPVCVMVDHVHLSAAITSPHPSQPGHCCMPWLILASPVHLVLSLTVSSAAKQRHLFPKPSMNSIVVGFWRMALQSQSSIRLPLKRCEMCAY